MKNQFKKLFSFISNSGGKIKNAIAGWARRFAAGSGSRFLERLKRIDAKLQPFLIRLDVYLKPAFNGLGIGLKFIIKILQILGRILRKGVRFWAGIFRFILRGVNKVLGMPRLGYNPPAWYGRIQERFQALKEILLGLKNEADESIARRFRALGMLSLLLLTFYLGLSFIFRDTRSVVEYSLKGPALQALKEDAKPSPLYIQFSDSVAKLEDVNKTLKKGVLLTPELKGNWDWTSDRNLRFTPLFRWQIGRKYKITLAKDLFPAHVRPSDYEIELKTPEFRAKVVKLEFHTDPDDPGIRQALATLSFSHPVDRDDFKKRITLTYGPDSKKLTYTVNFDKFGGKAFILSENIPAPEKDRQVSLEIKSGCRSALGGPEFDDSLQQKLLIRNKYDIFQIQDLELAKVRNTGSYEVEQVMIWRSSLPFKVKGLLNKLEVYQLPLKRPKRPGIAPEEGPTDWGNREEIDSRLLKKSLRIRPVSLPVGRKNSLVRSFKYGGKGGRYLYVRLRKGLRSFGGFSLKNNFTQILKIPEVKPEVRILQEGAILSLSGSRKLAMMAYNVEAVRIEVGRVIPDQINHLISQSSGSFSKPRFTNFGFKENNISRYYHKVLNLKKSRRGGVNYFSFDFSQYLAQDSGRMKNGLFFLNVKACTPGKDCDPNKYQAPRGNDYDDDEYRGEDDYNYDDDDGSGEYDPRFAPRKKDSRLILVTNLGLLEKTAADGNHSVFVQSIFTGRPVPGAKVDVVGKNGLAVLSGYADEFGQVKFPGFSAFSRGDAPIAYVARQDRDMSFLPIGRIDRRLSYSRFNTHGVSGDGVPDRLQAYLFSDRGIYRPGDEMNIGMIIKSADWKRNLKGVPLEAVIRDARELEVHRKLIKLSSEGFESLSFTTGETAPTGSYDVELYLVGKDKKRGDLLGSVNVRVEEFLPDKLRIQTGFSRLPDDGWVKPDITGRVKLENLFGTPATAKKVKAEITLRPTLPRFSKFRDYRFHDPFRARHGFQETLGEKRTDKEGRVEFKLNLQKYEKAAYMVTLRAEGFEAGDGRAVSSESSVMVSPLEYLVGYKENGDLKYVNLNSFRSINLISINSRLQRVKTPGLRAQLVEVRQVSVLTKQESGVYKYQSVRKEISRGMTKFVLRPGGYNYNLPTGKPGDFILKILDRDGSVLNKVSYFVAGQGNIAHDMEHNAELQIRLDKETYTPGGFIRLNIRAPFTGAGLITIEKDRVYATKWFRTSTTSSVQLIRIPPDLEGNGYINVSFVRALDSPQIYTSPLSYAVKPFALKNVRRENRITLSVPRLVKPGQELKIRYRSSDAGKIVLMAVDEGILQVAGHQTPDPLSFFFRKRALEVQTTQIMDLLLPEYRLVKALSHSGGGGMEEAGKNLNPFKRKRDKPVVFWSGIVNSGPGFRTLRYKLPSYFNGRVRIMAVAVSRNRVGAASTSTLVRGDFIITPNLPLFAAPGDVFEVAVGISNNLKRSPKNLPITLKVKPDSALEVIGPAKKSLTLGRGSEGTLTFRLRAKQELGGKSVRFTASGGGKKVQLTETLSLRPPMPYITDVYGGILENAAKTIEFPAEIFPHFSKNKVALSHLPLGLSRGLVDYLDAYPYGCTEQILSRAFPALVLDRTSPLGDSRKNSGPILVNAMNVLQSRQNAAGGFGFWSANTNASDFQSLYSLHFLLEAKERGRPVSENLLNKAISFAKNIAGGTGKMENVNRNRAYAIYLLTRAGQATGGNLNSLRGNLKGKWKQDVTALYMAAAYDITARKTQGLELIRSFKMNSKVADEYHNYYDQTLRNAVFLYILARRFPKELGRVSGRDLMDLTEPILSGKFNTLSSAYTVMALSALTKRAEKMDKAKLLLSEFEQDKQSRNIKIPGGAFPTATYSHKAKGLRVENKSSIPLFYQVTRAGFQLRGPTKPIKQKLEVHREFQDMNNQVIEQAKVGQKIKVVINLRSLAGSHSNIAVVNLLPAGFEIVNEESRMKSVDYLDIREDRALIFTRADSSIKKLSYVIRAVNPGTFSVPPILAESMYDRSVRAIQPGGSFLIEANDESKKKKNN